MEKVISLFICLLTGLPVCLCGLARGGAVSTHVHSQTVTIRFPEPVVSASAVWENEEMTQPQLFQVTGDSRHVPLTDWSDQDKLEINFPSGTSCGTQYKLVFREGATYLGGATMKNREYTFYCPPSPLSTMPVTTSKGCAVLVTPLHHNTRESQLFSEKSAVQYEFRRVKRSIWSGKPYLGRRVAAVVEPARVCDGVTEPGLERLAAAGQKVWGKLKPDSAMPGHVLVRPAEELDSDETWVLLYSGAAGSGIMSNGIESDDDTLSPENSGRFRLFHPQNELLSGLRVTEFKPDAGEVELQLFFSQPLPEKALPELFSRLEFSIDGEGTTEKTKEGRRLTLNDRVWLLFRYGGILPYTPQRVRLPGDTGTSLAYQASGMASGIRIRVSGVLPAVLDVTVPRGTASANGAVVRDNHVHRIALNPAWPQISADSENVLVLPVKAEHKLRLPTANISAVDVQLRRVHSSQVTDAAFSSMYDSRERDKARYTYRIHRERKSENLPAVKSSKLLENELQREEESLENIAESRELWQRDALTYPLHRFDLKGSAMFRSSELVLDMDALAGEKLQPGVYLVTLKVTPNAHVQYALSLQNQRADALNYELDIPVLVTDLNVICSEQGVLVTRFSDGSVVSDAELLKVVWNEKTEKYEEKTLSDCSGVAFLRGEGQRILARSGQDMAWGRMPYKRQWWNSPPQPKAEVRAFLLTDRSLYRPGDTVHIRGLLRGFRKGIACPAPQKKVQLTVHRPNDEQLVQQEVSLSEYGGFEAEVKLPDGEDDVTGTYELTVRFGNEEETLHIRCQAARRNAFEASLAAEAEKVAPQKLTLRVQADDYSGVPLAGAVAELVVTCGSEEEKHTVVTDAAGSAVLELPMKEEWLRQGILSVSGSIANDREEYVTFESSILSFSPADFRIRYADSRLFAEDAVTSAPLNREQRITLRLVQDTMKTRHPRACFAIMDSVQTTVVSAEITIPANSRQGVPLPADIMRAIRRLTEDDAMRVSELKLECYGKDAAGREAFYSVVPGIVGPEREEDLHLRLEPEKGMVRAHFFSPYKGVAHVFVGCGERLRHLQKPVEQGEQVLVIPLQRHEEGTVSLSLVLPRSGRNADSRFCADTATCFVPVVRQHLDVTLQLPQEASRPGQKVLLSGLVQAEGKPADAEVTLYAVDEGMLSLFAYEKPDPEKFFASGDALTFSPSFDTRALPEISSEMMEAVWQGDLTEGDCLSLSLLFSGQYAGRGEVKSLPVSGIMTAGLRSGSEMTISEGELPPWLLDEDNCDAVAPAPVTALYYCPPSDSESDLPLLRSNFEPLAVWKGSLQTDAEGRFSVEAELPDTLTSYRVFAVAADRSGSRFGSAEGSFVVNLPVMITPGMPLFMSLGDELSLPLTVTNATKKPGVWTVSMEGCDTQQQIELPAGGSGTLYFTVSPRTEGECCLRWQAVGDPGADAVQGTCQVRFPAPLLREVHRPEQTPGQEALRIASLFAPETAQSGRAEVEVLLSASPLLHLRGCLDFLLNYPYGCTEQRASALMPWLLWDELSAFCPQMARQSREEVREHVEREISALFARQCSDGGLGYWKAGEEGCAWASAYAAMALTVAAERGYTLPQDRMKRLLRFVEKQDYSHELFVSDAELMAARVLGEQRRMQRLLERRCAALAESKKAGLRPGVHGATLLFLQAVEKGENAGEAFRDWLRTVGHDYRHAPTTHSALVLLALHDFLRKQAVNDSEVTAVTDSGRYQLRREPLKLSLPQVKCPAELPTTLAAEGGTVYALVQLKAQPEQTEFPGVTEKGLQVTRVYEVKGADGKWHKAPDRLNVGDVVRVTLTCAKAADELEYFVLEDYLPACMEAINPEIPSQAAGLEFVPWSRWFDHREYLTDRVRGFCTRWSGRDVLNMTYFARVKRAGIATAPPAQAQLMYEPQVYGLSPNSRVITVPAE